MRNWPWYAHVFLAVIIFGLFFLIYFKPKNQELKNVRTDRIKVEEEVVHLQAKKKQLDQIEIELKNLDAVLKEIEVIIPKKKEISEILRKIQQLAYDSRLDIVRFIPRGEINKEFYSEWPISIEITGNYHNLAMFFDLLSNFSRLFNVENFKINTLRNQIEGSTISANWTAKTYIFLEPSLPSQKAPQKRGRTR